MVNNIVRIIVVFSRLRHIRTAITINVYSHLIYGIQSQVAELMDELVMSVAAQID
jgi:hypothetical protein